MKVFISWSGDQSRELANALARWLSNVIQAVEPWVSTSIEKGVIGLEEVVKGLESSNVGVICLTRANLSAPWILFEAGAIAKARERVWTLLLDIKETDVEPPLGMFQHTYPTRDDMHALVRSINAQVRLLGERALAEKQLDDIFDIYWPQLDAELVRITAMKAPDSTPVRAERELIEEALQQLREQGSTLTDVARNVREFIDEHSYSRMMTRSFWGSSRSVVGGPTTRASAETNEPLWIQLRIPQRTDDLFIAATGGPIEALESAVLRAMAPLGAQTYQLVEMTRGGRKVALFRLRSLVPIDTVVVQAALKQHDVLRDLIAIGDGADAWAKLDLSDGQWRPLPIPTTPV